jgi:hypothetical protein
MMSPTFVCTVTVLIAVAVVGVLLGLTAKRRQGRGISAMMLAFGAVALSAGALTWAAVACACQVH